MVVPKGFELSLNLRDHGTESQGELCLHQLLSLVEFGPKQTNRRRRASDDKKDDEVYGVRRPSSLQSLDHNIMI